MPLYIKNIEPNLEILGDTQQFVFNSQLKPVFELYSSNEIIEDNNINFDFKNQQNKGYRFGLMTSPSNLDGMFHLSSFYYDNAAENSTFVSERLFTFNENGNGLFTFNKPVSFDNGLQVVTPVNPLDAANKQYVDDTVVGLETTLTLDGDVSGTGLIADPITVTINAPINSLSIDNNIDISGYRVINSATPVNNNDLATKLYVDQATGGPTSITLTGDVSGSGASDQPIITTLNKTLNQLSVSGDVNVSGYKITNSSLPINSSDLTNKSYVDNAISSLSNEINLTGDITGNGVLGSDITTTFTKTLNTISTTGNISVNDYKIINLNTPTNTHHATNKAYVDAGDSRIFNVNPLNWEISNQFDSVFGFVRQNQGAGSIRFNMLDTENVGSFFNTNISGGAKVDGASFGFTHGNGQEYSVFDWTYISGPDIYNLYLDAQVVVTDTLNVNNNVSINGNCSVSNNITARFIDITGGDDYTLVDYGYLNSAGQVKKETALTTKNYSLRCSQNIAAVEFNAYSSIKKKSVLSYEKEFQNDLKDKFDNMPFVKYEFKDKHKDGYGEYYGIIAEDLQNNFPNLVDETLQDYAPNILKSALMYKEITGEIYIVFNEEISVNIEGKELLFSFDEKETYIKYNEEKEISKDVEDKEYQMQQKAVVIKSINQKKFSIYSDFVSNLLQNKKNTTSYKIFVYGSYEVIPTVSKIRFHDMVSARLKLLINQVNCIEKRLDNISL